MALAIVGVTRLSLELPKLAAEIMAGLGLVLFGLEAVRAHLAWRRMVTERPPIGEEPPVPVDCEARRELAPGLFATCGRPAPHDGHHQAIGFEWDAG